MYTLDCLPDLNALFQLPFTYIVIFNIFQATFISDTVACQAVCGGGRVLGQKLGNLHSNFQSVTEFCNIG